jgi:hypothetical protein
MPRSSPSRSTLLASGLLGLILALHPARALAAAAKPAPYDFKVCRIPGMDAAISNQTIVIPAGTEFDARRPSDGDPVQANAGPARDRALVTTASATLPADGFCIAVPVKPRGKIGADAIRRRLGEMYEPVGDWHGAANAPVSLTYGYWQEAGE